MSERSAMDQSLRERHMFVGELALVVLSVCALIQGTRLSLQRE